MINQHMRVAKTVEYGTGTSKICQERLVESTGELSLQSSTRPDSLQSHVNSKMAAIPDSKRSIAAEYVRNLHNRLHDKSQLLSTAAVKLRADVEQTQLDIANVELWMAMNNFSRGKVGPLYDRLKDLCDKVKPVNDEVNDLKSRGEYLSLHWKALEVLSRSLGAGDGVKASEDDRSRLLVAILSDSVFETAMQARYQALKAQEDMMYAFRKLYEEGMAVIEEEMGTKAGPRARLLSRAMLILRLASRAL